MISSSLIITTLSQETDDGELDTFEFDCDENELDCDFYDEDDDDDYEDEYYEYNSGDGEILPDSVQPIPFEFGGEDVSVNDFVILVDNRHEALRQLMNNFKVDGLTKALTRQL